MILENITIIIIGGNKRGEEKGAAVDGLSVCGQSHCCLRDWSVVTRRGATKREGGGGAREGLPLLKGGGADKLYF